MKKTQFGESRAHRFFSGKGFYVALAVSLVAVVGAAWLGVNSAMDKLQSDTPQPPEVSDVEEDAEWTLPSDYEVNQTPSNVPAPSEPSSAPSSQQQEEPAAAVIPGYALPLKGEVLNPYSGDKVVKSKTLDDWVMHTGVDLAAEDATPVKAMAAGTVSEIKNDSLWGTTVTIEHADGIVSYYANLKSAVPVKEGQTVNLGDVIGNVGQTADIERAEESHLHFGVKKDGEWIDPMSLIS